MQLVIEGIVTTIGADGKPHAAPMGPRLDESRGEIELRPFQTSTTWANLLRTGEGVFHVIDDVELLARAAVGKLGMPRMLPARCLQGVVLADACRWYEFRIRSCVASQPRATMLADVVGQGRLRDFAGFNRAKHAVLEAAILATRIGILDWQQIDAELLHWAPLVEKTGGPAEHAAWQFLEQHFNQARQGNMGEAATGPQLAVQT